MSHSEKFRKQLLKKLPVTGAKDESIFLGRPFFKSLSDTEFVILWNTPGLNIVIGPNAAEYVKERQERLNLKESKNAGYNLNHPDKKEEEK